MRTAVIGAGSFGTCLAMQLGRLGHDVHLWDHRAERARATQTSRQSDQYLPGITLPDTVTVGSDLHAAVDSRQLVVAVVPSSCMREVFAQVGDALQQNAIVCSAAKGVEAKTYKTMSQVLQDVLPERHHDRICALSGPSFAAEVAKDLPTAVVVAGHDEIATHRVASAFHGSKFRVYHSDDVLGVELGGALKNVMAIACGISDGMGLGLNARGAIITRGLAEITRIGVIKGANPMTFAGLAGMGDLVLTCTGDLSRNRRVGLALGQGKTLTQILDELGQVAEGVKTARSAWNMASRLDVDVPITEQIYRILYEDKPAAEAMTDLLSRRRKAERDV